MTFSFHFRQQLAAPDFKSRQRTLLCRCRSVSTIRTAEREMDASVASVANRMK